MVSILSNEKECFICQSPNIHKHHIFGGANRKPSEQYGLWVYLCPYHHNMSDKGVHFDRKLDTALKRTAQTAFEMQLGTRDDFMKIFGRNWL